MRQRERSSEVRRRSQEAGTENVPQVNLCLWQESQWIDTYKETMKLHYQYKERVHAKEGEGIPIVKRREERGI